MVQYRKTCPESWSSFPTWICIDWRRLMNPSKLTSTSVLSPWKHLNWYAMCRTYPKKSLISNDVLLNSSFDNGGKFLTSFDANSKLTNRSQKSESNKSLWSFSNALIGHITPKSRISWPWNGVKKLHANSLKLIKSMHKTVINEPLKVASASVHG